MLDQIISLLGCFVSRFTCRDQALLTYGDEIRSLRAELVAVSADGQAVDLRDEREKYQNTSVRPVPSGLNRQRRKITFRMCL